MGDLLEFRRRSPEVTPELPPDAASLCRLARSLEAQAPALARTTYQAAIAVDPCHAPARINFGRLLHESGEVAHAVAEYRAALTADPSNATAAFNLGVALEDLGRLGEARAAYARAILADPDCADAHFNLARLLEPEEPRQALRHLVVYRRLTRSGVKGR
jgi:tetratricopeptide (TPR) repeat protein